jgi:DNA-binding transcriptional LysR family regulator
MNLYGLDLNLLVAFDALMEERSVTQAAKRVGLSQPAMSNALRRLRDMLEDEVLVREGHGMRPTPRALELERPIRLALRGIHDALEPAEEFDPAKSDRVFWLGGRDYIEAVLMPTLMRRLMLVAPGVDVRVRPSPGLRAPLRELEEGQFDLAVSYFPGLDSEYREQQTLFHEGFRVIARMDHPAIDDDLTLELFAELPHLLLAPQGGEVSPTDAALAARGLSRRVALTVANFMAAPQVVAETDLISVLPTRIAMGLARWLPIRLFHPPLELGGADISMLWNERTSDDPSLRWLRGEIARVAATI